MPSSGRSSCCIDARAFRQAEGELSHEAVPRSEAASGDQFRSGILGPGSRIRRVSKNETPILEAWAAEIESGQSADNLPALMDVEPKGCRRRRLRLRLPVLAVLVQQAVKGVGITNRVQLVVDRLKRFHHERHVLTGIPFKGQA